MKQLRLRTGSSLRASYALAMFGFLAACSDSMALAPEISGSGAPAGENPPPPPPSTSGSALAGRALHVPATSPALEQANAWRASRPADAGLMERIAGQPVAKWLGEWSGDVRAEVSRTISAAAGRIPVFVVYNIPNRDCGSYSAGGATSAAGYKGWIRQVAAGLSSGAVVIVEPDAVAGMDCLSAAMQDDRAELLRDAVTVLKGAGAIVYLDAGHARWHSASTMAERLRRTGIANADGFALNVSNYVQSEENIRYGEQVSSLTGGRHFIIDTSRNGIGPISADAWCNPRGRALGKLPTTNTGHALIDAFLWVKVPGESDGTCNGGPSAGAWWAEYALELARNQPASFLTS